MSAGGTEARPSARILLMLGYDGVVADSLEVFGTCFLEVCRQLRVPGVTTPDDVPTLFEGDLYGSLLAAGASADLAAAALTRTAAALRIALPWTRPFPLMAQIIAELAETRHIVLVTANEEAVVQAFLRRYGIGGVAEVAGAAAGHETAAKITALRARFPGQDEYLFVGGTGGEMHAARRACVTPLGVAWGWHAPEALEAAGAEGVVSDPAELLARAAPELEADFRGAEEGVGGSGAVR